MAFNKATILLVDPDGAGRRALADNLISDGYDVLLAASFAASRRALNSHFVDLAIVSPDLPDGDGLGVISLVRQADRLASRIDADIPLLVVSGRSTELERVRYLEQGCDDFIARPYAYTELRARVNALLRRRQRGVATVRLRVGPLEVDALGRRAWLDRRPVHLSSKEFSLLRTLASDPGRVFSREELLEVVWGWSEPGASARTRTLDTHASRLRRKLAADGVNFVINVWGVGYRLTDAVEPMMAAELRAS